MLKHTQKRVKSELLAEASRQFFEIGKHVLNVPTNKFFYDKWEMKQEYKNTVWELLLEPIKHLAGEARIVVLDSPSAYTRHADLDDRFHLNISGDHGYLLDLENYKIHPCVQDGIWYEMNAGICHSAISIGSQRRVQLVVRKLLQKNDLSDYTNISLSLKHPNDRYHFDNVISPWLNTNHKDGTIANCSYKNSCFEFQISNKSLSEFEKLLTKMPVDIFYEKHD